MALANAVCLLLLGSIWALAQSGPSVQLCQVALGEKISFERPRRLALEPRTPTRSAAGSKAAGKALLSGA
jgi:hypothetical protein